MPMLQRTLNIDQDDIEYVEDAHAVFVANLGEDVAISKTWRRLLKLGIEADKAQKEKPNVTR